MGAPEAETVRLPIGRSWTMLRAGRAAGRQRPGTRRRTLAFFGAQNYVIVSGRVERGGGVAGSVG